MQELPEIRKLLELKQVERILPVGVRKESTAEHTWACMVLADYFLEKFAYPLNRKKVFELLLYHDLVEIETGDVNFVDEARIQRKKEREEAGARELQKKIPKELRERYAALFREYEDMKTMEARFCHAVDKLEPILHILDQQHAPVWREHDITEAVLREKKQHFVAEFPELRAFFEELLGEAQKAGVMPEK